MATQEQRIEIRVAATDPERIRMLRAKVTDRVGDPIAGATVTFTIDGNGTFDGFHIVTTCDEPTGKSGEAYATWYEFPRYSPRRDLFSVVCASCEGDAAIDLDVPLAVTMANTS